MVKWVVVLAAKPENLNLIPRTHMMECTDSHKFLHVVP